MPEENLAIQTARIEERLKIVLEEIQEAAASRKQQYRSMEEMRLSIQSISHRVEAVETTLTKNAPALSEYTEIKNKIIGAGLFGKWIWMAAGALLGFAISVKGLLPWIPK